MGFADAISSCLKNYVGFSGRAPRSEYWFWILFVLILTIVASIIDFILDMQMVAPLVSLAVFLPGLAVSIRRLHDIDRSGWWVLIALTIIGIILLIVWACTKGTTGPNSHGPDPLPLG